MIFTKKYYLAYIANILFKCVHVKYLSKKKIVIFMTLQKRHSKIIISLYFSDFLNDFDDFRQKKRLRRFLR